ncbi:Holliday junction ATP-dependent DNA helicase RuvA [Planctomycetales bacterium 10988]|nr:Holliday junction ATP-dependent DNA helicase RuvA [Planctomycetales bacterium 10988]
MITKITGTLQRVGDDSIRLSVEAFEYEIMLPEFVRRQLQSEVGKKVSLHTIQFFEGNPMQGRMIPRMVGFSTEIERQFFDLICSVDGLGTKKALRAMVRPVAEVAEAIQQQDTKILASLPGIGPAMAERIIAKLRRKVPQFALMVTQQRKAVSPEDRSLVDEAFEVLQAVGHAPAEAQRMIEGAMEKKRKFKDVQDLLQAVYQQEREQT